MECTTRRLLSIIFLQNRETLVRYWVLVKNASNSIIRSQNTNEEKALCSYPNINAFYISLYMRHITATGKQVEI